MTATAGNRWVTVNVRIVNAWLSIGLFNIVVHTEVRLGNSGDSWLSDL